MDPYKKKAVKLENEIFSNCKNILVISDGMKDYYYEKYRFNCATIKHSISLDALNISPSPQNELKNNIFWGGEIYSINKNSIARISEARLKFGLNFELTCNLSIDQLESKDINVENVIIESYKYADYINAVRRSSYLLLALDWPDETNVHYSELSTIFPTKTLEYLMSQRPIIVHCPEDYYIARFFKKYDCK